MSSATDEFRAARDFLLAHRTDYATAYAQFRWPRPERFNFAFDWFDRAGRRGTRPPRCGSSRRTDRRVVQLRRRCPSDPTRSRAGCGPRASTGMQVLVVLGNQVELWEITLAAMKLGAVIIPATTLLADGRPPRTGSTAARCGAVVARSDATEHSGRPGGYLRIAVGEPVAGWLRYADAFDSLGRSSRTCRRRPTTRCCSTSPPAPPRCPSWSSTPNVSYPIGHLSTMYWIGLQPGDVHLNISSPGLGQARLVVCVRALDRRGDGLRLQLRALRRAGRCSTSCAARGDDVLRAADGVADADPGGPGRLADAAAGGGRRRRAAQSRGDRAGPRAWGLTIRDGFGQTETTLQVGNSPGQPVRRLDGPARCPGYAVALVDPVTGEPRGRGRDLPRSDPSGRSG